MRAEVAASKLDRMVKPASRFEYNLEAADLRDLLLALVRRIKELECQPTLVGREWVHESYTCGND